MFVVNTWAEQVLIDSDSSPLKTSQKTTEALPRVGQNVLGFRSSASLENSKTGTDTQFEDVKSRLNSIRSFIPAPQYLITFKWVQDKQAITGFLKGEDKFDAHLIQIHLKNSEETTVFFDKLHPEESYLKGKKLPITQWLEPIYPQCSVCYFMIAMPFLTWEPISVERIAKRGRHVLKVLLSAPKNFPNIETVLVYIDKNFNTILEAHAFDAHKKTLVSFVLKSFKKYNRNSWYLKAATFSCGANQTYMQVIHWETLAAK